VASAAPRSPGPALGVLAAVGLVWNSGPSVGVRDAGELATAAFRIDVAHPTGFPVDLVLARVGMLLPFGDVAFRANVATALWMAAALGLAAHLAFRMTHATIGSAGAYAAAIATVAVLATSRSVMRAGTAVEVYASALAVAMFAVTCLGTGTDVRPRADARTLALLGGVSLGLHTSARPALLVVWIVLVVRAGAWRSPRRTVPTMLALAALGSAIVAYIPVAARRAGPVNWGDPSTLARLAQHLSATRIRAAFAHRILVPWRIPEDTGAALRVMREDLGAWVLLLAIGGVAMTFVPRKSRGEAPQVPPPVAFVRLVAVIGLIDAAYAILINPMGIGDRQTLFVAEVATTLCAVWAVAECAVRIRAGSSMRASPSAIVLVAASAALAIAAFVRADGAFAAKRDGWSATEILGGAGALGSVPARAVVLCESDDLCGGALYAQWVEGERPDVVVVPRQHLGEPATWSRTARRLARAFDGHLGPGRTIRAARLRALVAQLQPWLRWEMGEITDERVARIALASAETPVLARVALPYDRPTEPVTDRPTPLDEHAWVWLDPRTSDGVGSRRLAAQVLFSAGRRIAMNDLQRAVPTWERSVRLDPEHAPAYTNLGVARARVGDLVGAIDRTERALRIDPDRLTAWQNLADFCEALGRTERAAAALRQIERRRH